MENVVTKNGKMPNNTVHLSILKKKGPSQRGQTVRKPFRAFNM